MCKISCSWVETVKYYDCICIFVLITWHENQIFCAILLYYIIYGLYGCVVFLIISCKQHDFLEKKMHLT
jgi:hypothetical protein